MPRRINLLCDRALLGAYSTGQARVNTAVVNRAAEEVFGYADASKAASSSKLSPAGRTGWLAFVGLAFVCVFGLVTWAAKDRMRAQAAAQPAASSASASAAWAASASASAALSRASASATASPAASAPAAPLTFISTDLQAKLSALLDTEDAAIRELSALWKLNLSALPASATSPTNAADACAAAQRSQVFCLRSKSNLALIRQLNRPGVVTLFDAKDQPHYALLTALTSQTATLRAAGEPRIVPLWALAAVWRGDFTTLWRAPADYRGMLQLGSVGSGVQQLAAQLAAQQGQAAPAATAASAKAIAFDNALKAKVEAFQISQGLAADGVVGPTTFMQLNRASGVDEPRLFADSPASSR